MTGTQSIAAFSTGVSSGSGLVYDFTGTRTRVPVTQASNGWTDTVMNRLQDLIHLPMGWDGYRGQPVSFANANFALQMLNVICGPDTRAPQIVPGAEGDLQIEWHTLQGDLELHVKSPNDVHVWYCATGDDAEGEEQDLTVDFVVVAEWVSEIAEPPLANAVAA